MGKNNAQNNDARIATIAAEAASKAALETYAKEKRKERRILADRRLRDTKRLMNNYREIKIHAGDAIASLREVENEDYEFFRDLIEYGDTIEVAAIVRSKAKSAIMLVHIDAMLQAYQSICYGSNRPEEIRRYRVLEARCLIEKPLTAPEIAQAENIDIRTVYKDFDAACEKISALLFGIQWISN